MRKRLVLFLMLLISINILTNAEPYKPKPRNVNVRDMTRHEILKQVQDDNKMVWNDDITGRNESHFCCPVVCK